jgi:ankyrin repeat protein
METETLAQAFHRDDVATVREALRKNPELKKLVNAPIGPFDSPPICGVRSREMFDALLEAGADINGRSKWWAGSFGLLDSASDELSEYAISKGATLTVHAAARLGKLDRLRELMEADPNLVHARGGDGKMPLHLARNIEIAKYLLERGADMDARDIDHESTAAQHLIGERMEVVRFLASAGCETDIFLAAALRDLELAKKHLEANPGCVRMRINKEHFPMSNPRAGGTIYIWTLGSNLSPHQVARKFGHEEILNFLIERSPDDVRLVTWCWLGEEKRAKDLAAEAISRDPLAVVQAAREDNTKAALLMLELGFPIEGRGQHGGTALHWAAWQGNAELAKALLANGATEQLRIRDDDFKATPLDWAKHGRENCGRGDYETVIDLLTAAGK